MCKILAKYQKISVIKLQDIRPGFAQFQFKTFIEWAMSCVVDTVGHIKKLIAN